MGRRAELRNARARRAEKSAVGRKSNAVGWAHDLQKVLLSVFTFPEAFLFVFCSKFGQISTSFSYSKLSNENFVLGNRKVKELFLKSIKFMNFCIHIFSAANREMCSF